MRETVIIARTAEGNEQNWREAAAKRMNQVYSDQHNFNIMCTDRPVKDVEDMLPRPD
jgi:hypothetical protein